MRITTLFWSILLTTPLYSQWSPYCTNQFTSGTIVEFTQYQGSIHATGLFDRLCFDQVDYLGRLNGQGTWDRVGPGLSDEGHAITVIDNALLIASYHFNSRINFIQRWNGTTLSRLGDTLYYDGPMVNAAQAAHVYDVIEYQGQPVATGEFNRVGKDTVNGIMQWNGQSWLPLGKGLSGSNVSTYNVMYPHQLLVWNDDLYVVGNFSHAGDSMVNGVARWDGSEWHPVGAGFDGVVYALAVFQNKLYAGGDFQSSNGISTRCIARWSGSQWEEPNFGVSFPGGSPFIHTLEAIDGQLFALGRFTTVETTQGTLLANNILAFDGQQVDTLLGGRVNSTLEAIIPYQGGYLVGGGNGSTGTIDIFTSSPTGISSFEDKSIGWPNPATTFIYLPTDQSIEWVSLMNSCGQMVSLDWQPGQQRVQWSSLPAGVYYLTWLAKGERYRQQVSILPSAP